MSKTGKGLADYALAQLGRPYWWGTFGQVASADLLAAKKKQYPDYYQSADFPKQFGQRVHDCVGLVKGYLWSDGPDTVPKYNAAQDVAVAGLYNNCVKTGAIGTLPEIPGVCVFMQSLGHVGVYVGQGWVVEAQGHASGVVKTALKGRGWAMWGMPKWIEYGEATEQPAAGQGAEPAPAVSEPDTCTVILPVLQIGDEGEAVRAAQYLLRGRGFSVGWFGCDGEFGRATESAVGKFQADRQITRDGIIGPETWGKLICD